MELRNLIREKVFKNPTGKLKMRMGSGRRTWKSSGNADKKQGVKESWFGKRNINSTFGMLIGGRVLWMMMSYWLEGM